MAKEKSLVPVKEKELQTFDPGRDVQNAQAAAKALMTVIDATKPLIMQGKRYLYFEHWQTIARFFNSTVGIDKTEKSENGYIAHAVVYNQQGIVIGGAEASCMKDERNWNGKPDFQLRSMAQTRAMAKALRSIYGFVAVLAGVEATPAEEMNGDIELRQAPKLALQTPKVEKIHYVSTASVEAEIKNAITLQQALEVKKRMQTAPIKPIELPNLQKKINDKIEMLGGVSPAAKMMKKGLEAEKKPDLMKEAKKVFQPEEQEIDVKDIPF